MAYLVVKAAIIDKKCAEVEALEHSSSKQCHERTREITGKFSGHSSATNFIRYRDGHILFDKEQILKRCKEYIQDFYSNSSRKVITELSGEVTCELIMVDEVEKALMKVPNEKASGCDIVPADLYKLFKDRLHPCANCLTNVMTPELYRMRLWTQFLFQYQIKSEPIIVGIFEQSVYRVKP